MKLKLTDKLILYNENITSKFYTLFNTNKSLIYQDTYNQYVNFENKYMKYLYDHLLIPYELGKYDTKHNLSFKLLKYKPIYHIYFRFNEILSLYFSDLKIKKIVNITDIPVLYEILVNKKLKVKEFNLINIKKKSNKKYIDLSKKIKNIFDINLIQKNNSYELLDFDKTKIKSDFISYSNYNINRNLINFNINYNDINLYIGMLFILKYLEKKGSAILYFENILNKNQADVYLILKKYFKESYLYYPEISNKIKVGGTNAIFKNFKGIPESEFKEYYNIYLKLKKEYPNNEDDLINLTYKEVLKHTNDQFIIKKNKKFITDGYLDNTNDKDYEEIRNYNMNKFFMQYIETNKLINLTKISDKELKSIQNPSEYQIMMSMLYLKKWNIAHYPYKTDKYIKDSFLTELYEDINPIYYKINTPYRSLLLNKYKPLKPKLTLKTKLKKRKTKKLKYAKNNDLDNNKDNVNFDKDNIDLDSIILKLNLDNIDKKLKKSYNEYEKYLNLLNELEESNILIEKVGYYIDSRRDLDYDSDDKQLATYDKYKRRYRFYNPLNTKLRLKNVVEEKFKTGEITQAFLKMWEILHKCNLVNPRIHKDEYKSFHLCEAPGQFIKSLNHYVKTHGIKKFTWHGQSLEPSKGGYSDSYGFFKKYPKRWHWGDITKLENVKKYKNMGLDVNLITSDCGLSWGDPRYYNVAACSYMAILMLLPIGSDMIYKILLPAKPIVWNMIYISYQYFQDLIFYKPVQNYHSREFYIIGKKFLGLPQQMITIFEHIFKNYNDDIDLFNGEYPEPFVLQMKKFNTIFASNYANTIEKQIFTMDNIDLIEDQYEKLIFSGIKEKNEKWITDFNFRKLDKHLFL